MQELLYQIVFSVGSVWLVGRIVRSIAGRVRRQSGVTMVEYAILLAMIAIAVALAAPNITSAVVGVFAKASSVMVVK